MRGSAILVPVARIDDARRTFLHPQNLPSGVHPPGAGNSDRIVLIPQALIAPDIMQISPKLAEIIRRDSARRTIDCMFIKSFINSHIAASLHCGCKNTPIYIQSGVYS